MPSLLTLSVFGFAASAGMAAQVLPWPAAVLAIVPLTLCFAIVRRLDREEAVHAAAAPSGIPLTGDRP